MLPRSTHGPSRWAAWRRATWRRLRITPEIDDAVDPGEELRLAQHGDDRVTGSAAQRAEMLVGQVQQSPGKRLGNRSQSDNRHRIEVFDARLEPDVHATSPSGSAGF